MLKVLRIFIMSILFVAIMTGSAHAGVLDKVKSWITGDVMAFFLSGIVVILGGMFGTALKKIQRGGGVFNRTRNSPGRSKINP